MNRPLPTGMSSGSKPFSRIARRNPAPVELAARAPQSRAGLVPVSVPVADLQRAWRIIRADSTPGEGAAVDGSNGASSWAAEPGERVLPVIGCSGSCGATTLALALAEAARVAARLVECSPSTLSGLVAASTAELGVHGPWFRGTRSGVVLDRTAAPVVSPVDVPTPAASSGVEMTVLDVSWNPALVFTQPCWLSAQVAAADPVVIVAPCTVPGMRRLESLLPQLPQAETWVVVVGATYRKWPRPVLQAVGERTSAVVADGRLVMVSADRRLAVEGLNSAPLPGSLADAATALLDSVFGRLGEGRAS